VSSFIIRHEKSSPRKAFALVAALALAVTIASSLDNSRETATLLSVSWSAFVTMLASAFVRGDGSWLWSRRLQLLSSEDEKRPDSK